MKKSKAIIFIVIFALLLLITALGGVAFAADGPKSLKPSDLFEKSDNTVLTDYASVPEYAADTVRFYGESKNAEDLHGLKLQSSNRNDTTIRFKNAVNVSQWNKEEAFLEFVVLPEQRGKDVTTNVEYGYEYPLTSVEITLTDAYDASNFLVMSLNVRPDVNYVTSYRGNANGQVSAGYLVSKGEMSEKFGLPCHSNFSGLNVRFGNYISTASFFLDYGTRAYYGYPTHGGVKEIVRDFDDRAYSINAGEPLWTGFSADEAYISVTIKGIRNNETGVYFVGFNGIDFTQETIENDGSTEITLNEPFTEQGLPYGEAGTPYRMYNVKCGSPKFGVVSEDAIEKKAYIYRDGSRSEIAVENGSIMPEEAGQYSFEYSVTDIFGDTVVREFRFSVMSRVRDLQMNFSSELPSCVRVGETVRLPKAEVEGGSGYAVYETSVVKNGEKREISDAFFADKQGYYQVVYTVKDYLRTVDLVYFVDCVLTKEPLLTAPNLPPVFSTQVPYVFADFEAIDYFSDENGMPAKKEIYIKENDGEFFKLGSDGLYVPTAESGSVTVKLRAGCVFDPAVVTEYILGPVPIYNPQTSAQYFYNNDGNVNVVFSESGEAIYTTSADRAEIEFVNPLPSENFRLYIEVPDQYNRLSEMVITLTDIHDVSQSVSFAVQKTSGKSIMNVCGKDIEIDNVFGSGKTFYLDLLNEKDIMISNNAVGQLESYADGSIFEGFTSGKVYLTIGMEGVSGEAGLSVTNLCGHTKFRNDGDDTIKPGIQLRDETRQTGEKGDTVIIPAAYAYDVMDAAVKDASVEVLYGSKVVLVQQSAATARSFIASETGEYKVVYAASDKTGNTRTLSYEIVIMDKAKPVVTLEGQWQDKAEVGSTIRLPKMRAVSEGDVKIYVFVKNPNGGMTEVDDTLQYTFENAGKYIVYYYAYGSNYTYVLSKGTITVS